MSTIVQAGLVADEALNVELGGMADETLSHRAAVACAEGSRRACLFCHVLDVLVQPHHCAKQLSGEPMHPLNYLRAAVCLAVAFGIQAAIIALIVRAL